jgi:hypothetical protein
VLNSGYEVLLIITRQRLKVSAGEFHQDNGRAGLSAERYNFFIIVSASGAA